MLLKFFGSLVEPREYDGFDEADEMEAAVVEAEEDMEQEVGLVGRGGC